MQPVVADTDKTVTFN